MKPLPHANCTGLLATLPMLLNEPVYWHTRNDILDK